MCEIQDECLLLVMLIIQFIGGMPVMALMRLCGVAYAIIFAVGFVLSLCLTFAPRLRWCCNTLVGYVNDYGICLFVIVHVSLLSLSTYTLYTFLIPFLRSDDFKLYCSTHKLYKNLTHTECDQLPGK